MPRGRPGRTVSFAASGGAATGAAGYPREQLLGALTALTRATAEAPSVPAGLARALDILCAALQWPIGHVYQRPSGAGQRLVSAQIWHLVQPDRFAAFQELTQQTTFRPGQGLVGQVLARRRPALSPDVARDRRFLRRRAAQAEGVHAWLAFPVLADGEVLAVCELFAAERVGLDKSLVDLLTCAGLALGHMYERERWRAEREALRQQVTSAGQGRADVGDAALQALAGAIAHEVNSPLFSARASLALLVEEPGSQPLLASAQADLTRIAAVMEQLNTLAQGAPIGQSLTALVDPPVD